MLRVSSKPTTSLQRNRTTCIQFGATIKGSQLRLATGAAASRLTTSSRLPADESPQVVGQLATTDRKRILEETFRLEGASSPERPEPTSNQPNGASHASPIPPTIDAPRAISAANTPSQALTPAPTTSGAAPAGAAPLSPLRAAVAWVVEAERRLEADLTTIGITVTFMVALIVYERGVQALMDNIFGDGPKGSWACVLMGLLLVFGVKLSGARLTAIWDISGGVPRPGRQ